MNRISLTELEARIDTKRKELGIIDSDILPNSGKRRTKEKIALLQFLRENAEKHNRQLPFKANW